MKKLQIIEEATYLSTLNAIQYRHIMRIFYNEYEKMNFQLYKEDVFEKLSSYEKFKEYSMEQLKLDLNALVKWRNLTTIQDPKRVYSIEEYKNKQFRYVMTEYAVEIERMTVKLENLFMESGNLSTNYIYRIQRSLEKIDEISIQSLKNINDWWHNLQEDFKRLNQNYQDYLREFYSGRTDKVLKSINFILRKDRFISYLNDFIKELKRGSINIENIFNNTSKSTENDILEQIIKSELVVPHTISESEITLEDAVRQNVYSKWEALKNWFISSETRISESSLVMEITDEIISKIIQNAALIVQLQNWGISRKDDYKKFMDLFLKCEDVEEAHQLSAHVFGIQHIHHFIYNQERSTDSINSSTYEEDAMSFLLKPHNTVYRPKVDKIGFENKSLEKQAQKAKYMMQLENDKKMVLKYIKDNRLDISTIEDCITENTRITLLRWISLANVTKSKSGRTEFGQEFKLIKTDGMCTLKCEDGDLVMPTYVFEFKEE